MTRPALALLFLAALAFALAACVAAPGGGLLVINGSGGAGGDAPDAGDAGDEQ